MTDAARHPPHLRLLNGASGLAVRLIRPPVSAWAAAFVAAGLIFGFIAKPAGSP